MSCRSEPTTPRAGNGDAPCDDPTQPCPLEERHIAARWLDEEKYCGDEARLEVTVTPAPPDGPATVEILHPQTGATVDTLNGTLTSGRMETKWVAKAQTANWRTDRISFRASAAGLTATSSNQFRFRHRPTTNWATLDVEHAKSDASLGVVYEYHDARLEADRVHYNIKIRTHGDAFGASKQTSVVNRIETVWNDGFSGKTFHRTGCQRGRTCDCPYDCCKASFRLDAEFVSNGEHLYVRIVHTAPGATRQGSSTQAAGGRPITGTWGDPPRNADSTYAHELGHILGQIFGKSWRSSIRSLTRLAVILRKCFTWSYPTPRAFWTTAPSVSGSRYRIRGRGPSPYATPSVSWLRPTAGYLCTSGRTVPMRPT